MKNNREQWSSKASFILAAAGSAVGLGNIWKFPYIAGENGGAAFLFIYLICILLIGLPILNIDILLGRATKKNPVGAFKTLTNNPSFNNPSTAGEFFNLKNSSPLWVLGYHTLFLSIVVLILLSGVRAGLEKASKFLMPILLFIILILVVQGLILPDANKGVSFLFQPDWSKINGQTILLALGHAFFTLSLGMGAMMTYGSYLSDNDDIVNASYLVAFLDTVIAILAGVAIFTVVFSSGYDPTAGPGLVFHVLPPLLSDLAGGYFFALLFFLLLSIAAVTSGISILEVSVAYLVDEKQYSRKNAVLTMAAMVYLAAIPCALSFNLLSDFTFSFQEKAFTFFDLADYLASNVLLPFGGFFIAVFAGYVWGIDEVIKNLLIGESNSIYFGNTVFKNQKFKSFFNFTVRYICPILIFLVFLY